MSITFKNINTNEYRTITIKNDNYLSDVWMDVVAREVPPWDGWRFAE